MKKKHVNKFECPACDEKLKDAHHDLVLFANRFRGFKQDAHISWAYRGKEDQEAFKAKGTSKAGFGESPHNYKPAMALDFFRIGLDGKADWTADWYNRFLGPAAREAGLVWGGDWLRFKDIFHVEIKNWKLLIKKE